MKNKELKFLDFDLEANSNKTNELDLLLDKKKNQEKLKILNSQLDINNLIKHKQSKNKRLQTYITNDLYLLIQDWKYLKNIKKDSDAIEILIRVGLKNVN